MKSLLVQSIIISACLVAAVLPSPVSADQTPAPAVAPEPPPATAPIAGIIPRPVKCTSQGGSFTLSEKNPIVAAPAAQATAEFLAIQLDRRQGRTPRIMETADAKTRPITLALAPDPAIVPEGYKLSIAEKGITVTAATTAGLFYGSQSLLQLIDAEIAKTGKFSGAYTLPCLEIDDAPRFKWRGIMLDEARHFFGKMVVYKLIDTMAYLKMNRLHWHLTDEYWRIEIKAFPKLTGIGARGQLSDPHAPALFYTQDEIRAIVKYAADRHVMIIPEIEMPGHTRGATVPYPELAGDPRNNGWKWFTVNPASPTVHEFYQKVLDEVAGLFPAPYIHLGGDECNYGWSGWQLLPEVKELMKRENLKNNSEVESWFMSKMGAYTLSKGKKPMGWEEITATNLPAKDVAPVWWHTSAGRLEEMLGKGYEVVLCATDPTYFDFIQDKGLKCGRGRVNATNEVYAYPDTLAKSVPSLEKAAGIQAATWTEVIHTEPRLWFMIFPRLTALAESAWTPASRKDYVDFTRRLPAFFSYLNRNGINYYNPLKPETTPEIYGPARIHQIEWGGWINKPTFLDNAETPAKPGK
jgi:hexosaminidase